MREKVEKEVQAEWWNGDLFRLYGNKVNREGRPRKTRASEKQRIQQEQREGNGQVIEEGNSSGGMELFSFVSLNSILSMQINHTSPSC